MKTRFDVGGCRLELLSALLVSLTLSSSDGKATKGAQKTIEEDAAYWNRVGENDLLNQLNQVKNLNVAKRVVVFIGDGMGLSTITAGRIYDGQSKGGKGEENSLAFENFPHTGLVKTYAVNKQVTDSAASAQAIFSGVKTNYGILGVDANVNEYDCAASLKPGYRTENIFSWAQKQKFATGFVGTTVATDATLAAVYSHAPRRYWQCNTDLTAEAVALGCKDIARQMMEDQVGRNLKVRMGGGRQFYRVNTTFSDEDPILTDYCVRTDGRDFVQEWLDEKANDGTSKVAYVTNSDELRRAREDKADEILGLFSNGLLRAEYERNKGPTGEPSLSEMAEAAVEVLNRQSDKLLLLVEGSNIDTYHHYNHAFYSLTETQEFSRSVDTVLKTLAKFGPLNDTLIVVTADHSHAFVIQGYPKRGHSILGLAEVSDVDGLPYSTLSYTNGEVIQFDTTGGSIVTRPKLTEDQANDPNFHQQAAVPRSSETHGGEDVAVFARGPMSHLFTGVHEQNYLAHAISYAACIGRYNTRKCRERKGL